MRCQCCPEEADSVLETLASGVSFLCEECADGWFISLALSNITFQQGQEATL